MLRTPTSQPYHNNDYGHLRQHATCVASEGIMTVFYETRCLFIPSLEHEAGRITTQHLCSRVGRREASPTAHHTQSPVRLATSTTLLGTAMPRKIKSTWRVAMLPRLGGGKSHFPIRVSSICMVGKGPDAWRHGNKIRLHEKTQEVGTVGKKGASSAKRKIWAEVPLSGTGKLSKCNHQS